MAAHISSSRLNTKTTDAPHPLSGGSESNFGVRFPRVMSVLGPAFRERRPTPSQDVRCKCDDERHDNHQRDSEVEI